MKKKCVVFMDFDGPLFSSRALMLPQNNEYAEYFLNELNLNRFLNNCKIYSHLF